MCRKSCTYLNTIHGEPFKKKQKETFTSETSVDQRINYYRSTLVEVKSIYDSIYIILYFN